MKIVLIGAGNVGYHLGQRLVEVGHQVVQVFSRTTTKAVRLARLLESSPVDILNSVIWTADIYIIAVKDDAIREVAEKLSQRLPQRALVVHTSGSTPISVFEGLFDNYGLLYPLQTFSVARIADFTSIPIFVAGNIDENRDTLFHFAETLSPNVYHIEEEKRPYLHLTAVMVNNFTNHLYTIASDILKDKNIPKEAILPLIQETAKKVLFHEPEDVQTGPAARGDEKVIEKHLSLLSTFPEAQEIYKHLSASIKERKNKLNGSHN